MAKGAYIGVAGAARKVTAAYIGAAGAARKVRKSSIGVNGVARESWCIRELPPTDEWSYLTCVASDYELYPISEITLYVTEVYAFVNSVDELQGAGVGDGGSVILGTPSDMTIAECYNRNGWALFVYEGAYFFAYDYIDDENRMFCKIFN